MKDRDLAVIEDAIVRYVIENHMSKFDYASLPRDQSLLEIGVIDSYGVVELISFLESNWNIEIADAEITKENLGSIYKMTTFVAARTSVQALARPTA
jgi:acyl carrier protein